MTEEVEEKKEEGEELPDPFDITLHEDEAALEEPTSPVPSEEKKETQVVGEKERELSERVARLAEDKKNLQKALHEERQSRKKAPEPEATLSDAELAKIIEEHKDDPAVLLNAVSYKVRQAMATGKKEAVDEVQVQQRKGELERVLRERYGEQWDDESSMIRTHAAKAKEFLGLEGHPYEDALSVSAAVFMALPQMLRESYDKGVQDKTSGKVEQRRKESIENGRLGGRKAPEGAPVDSKTGLTAEQLETAKRLGLDRDPKKLKIFRNQILKVGNA